MNKAVFFDKDGVLNVDRGIVYYNDIQLFQEAGNIISYCREKNYKIVIVTNQTIISRGILSEQDVKKHFDKLREMLLLQNKNALIDEIYYCPHHPNANIKEYRIICQCRKPKPGMLIEAANNMNIHLQDSYMIGDRISDIIAGKLVGCKTVQCLTGAHDSALIETDLTIPGNIIADYYIQNLSELMDVIL